MTHEDYRAIAQLKLALVERLEELFDYRQVYVYNILCEYTRAEYLYGMDFLDEYFSAQTATEIIETISDRFNTCNDWFAVDGWGFVESYEEPTDFIDLGDMANDMDYYRKELLSRDLPSSVITILEELDKIDRS